jgi:beta-glucosidase-like glycosyl hydrolase
MLSQMCFKRNWAFKVLFFTDALNMKAVSKFSTLADRFTRFSGGEMILLFPEDVPLALDAFRKAYHDSLFTDSRLASSVKKILKFNAQA